MALCLKWVSQLSTDHVVWLGDKHFVGFLLAKAIESVLENGLNSLQKLPISVVLVNDGLGCKFFFISLCSPILITVYVVY